MYKYDDRFMEFNPAEEQAITGEDILLDATSGITINNVLGQSTTIYSQQADAPTSMDQDSYVNITHPSMSGKGAQACFQVLEYNGSNYEIKTIGIDYKVNRVTDTVTRFTKISAGSATNVYCTVSIDI